MCRGLPAEWRFLCWKNLYIPIWFYSNFRAKFFKNHFVILYIPIWFYSNQDSIETLSGRGLYIPIWFYSNRNAQGHTCKCNAYFTFQSGSIQIFFHIILSANPLSLYIPIWFYSNAEMKNYEAITVAALHSNLVLFKFYSCSWVSILAILYIPIWFYSNATIFFTWYTKSYFTFQSGSIQIYDLILQCKDLLSLHSNLVLFKLSVYAALSAPDVTLHSNLVLFKCYYQCRYKNSLQTLHSNLVLFKYYQGRKLSQNHVTLHSNLVLFK